jgi:hypothetical protein
MIRIALALALLALAAPAFADDQQAANECIAAWGSKSPFKIGRKPDLIIGTGVKVFGLGKGQTNDTVTDKPSLVVVHPAVNVAGKTTIRLSNPNGWYCLRNQTTVAGKIAIVAHCNAHLAHTKDDGASVAAADDTGKGVAVMGALRVQRFGCKS